MKVELKPWELALIADGIDDGMYVDEAYRRGFEAGVVYAEKDFGGGYEQGYAEGYEHGHRDGYVEGQSDLFDFITSGEEHHHDRDDD